MAFRKKWPNEIKCDWNRNRNRNRRTQSVGERVGEKIKHGELNATTSIFTNDHQ